MILFSCMSDRVNHCFGERCPVDTPFSMFLLVRQLTERLAGGAEKLKGGARGVGHVLAAVKIGAFFCKISRGGHRPLRR